MPEPVSVAQAQHSFSLAFFSLQPSTITNVELLQPRVHLPHVQVVHFVRLGHVRAPGEIQPVAAARMPVHILTQVVPLAVHEVEVAEGGSGGRQMRS